jgi:hypothetical protein
VNAVVFHPQSVVPDEIDAVELVPRDSQRLAELG